MSALKKLIAVMAFTTVQMAPMKVIAQFAVKIVFSEFGFVVDMKIFSHFLAMCI